MNLNNNVRWLLAILFFGTSLTSFSQNQWTYDFNNGLNPIENGGPALKKLGMPGQFVREKISETEDLFRTVYKFEKNSGLQFDNRETKGFLNKSFTVEIYFKMDSLNNWKRILDLKNRKSNGGSYIQNGKLNFLDFAMNEKVPVRTNRYIHYVYSRDFDTKIIKLYINGLLKIEFTDPKTEGVLDNDQVLNLFQDDLIVGQESSAGSVALVRIYDRVMTPVFIRRSYQSLARTKQQEPVAEQLEEKEPEKTAGIEQPKRNPNLVLVSGKVYDGRTLSMVNNGAVSVRKTRDDSLIAQTKTVNGIYQVELPKFESYRILVDAPGFQSKSLSVTTTGKSQEIKSLFSLSPELYDKPITTLYFSQSTETLENEAKSRLDSLVSYFNRRTDLKILIKGHTDNIGDFDKNILLSAQRVFVVKEYLLAKGIPDQRIEGVGYGPTRPNYRNQSEEQKKLNRRVEIWVEPIKR